MKSFQNCCLHGIGGKYRAFLFSSNRQTTERDITVLCGVRYTPDACTPFILPIVYRPIRSHLPLPLPVSIAVIQVGNIRYTTYLFYILTRHSDSLSRQPPRSHYAEQ